MLCALLFSLQNRPFVHEEIVNTSDCTNVGLCLSLLTFLMSHRGIHAHFLFLSLSHFLYICMSLFCLFPSLSVRCSASSTSASSSSEGYVSRNRNMGRPLSPSLRLLMASPDMVWVLSFGHRTSGVVLTSGMLWFYIVQYLGHLYNIIQIGHSQIHTLCSV